jgi:hypothetical protein
MRTRTVLITLALLASSVPALAQKIGVKSATPSSGAQGTVGLDVVIAGNGFGPGAQARFVLSGTDNPDGVVVRHTRFVSNSQLVATIDIADTASLASFDIKVTLSGRTGKGTDLFHVVETIARSPACTPQSGASPLTLLGTLNEALPGGNARYSGGFGHRIRIAPARKPDGSTVLVAMTGTWFEAELAHFFFFDPVSLAQVQPPQSVSVAVDGGDFGPKGGIAVGDLDANGVPDFGMSFGQLGTALVMLGDVDADGTIRYGAPIPLPRPDTFGYFGSSLEFGDLDGVPGDEILVGHAGGEITRKVSIQGRVHVYAFTGSIDAPAFALRHSITPTTTPAIGVADGYGRALAVGDVTGDGAADILAGVGGRVLVLPGPGFDSNPGNTVPYEPSLVLTAPVATSDFGYKVAVVPDMSSVPDGIPDVVATTQAGSDVTLAALYPGFLMAGASPTAVFMPLDEAGDGSWAAETPQGGDINGDGIGDLVISAESARFEQGCEQIGVAYVYLSQQESSGAPATMRGHVVHAPTLYNDWARFGSGIGLAHGYRLLLLADYHRPVGSTASAGQVFVYRVN